jgi:hypothetical protein
VQNNYAPIAAAKNINKKFHNIEAEDENGNTMWEAVLWKGRLYVSLTANQLTGGSKEAFIMLLEYAEDVLDCSHVLSAWENQIHSRVLLQLTATKTSTPRIWNMKRNPRWQLETFSSWDFSH